MHSQRFKKFGLLGSLYLSQLMPFWFLYQALPVILRQKGLPLEAIGLLPLIVLPITLKFLWSPLIDRYSFTGLGHYQFWIACFQLWVAGITALCSLLSVENQLPLVLLGMAFIAVGCASQDIATDALALGLLEPEERGLGNAIQGIGGSLGSMIGGGGMLILLSRWGWAASLLTLATLMLVMLLPVLLHREKPKRSSRHSLGRANPLRSYFDIFLNFSNRPGVKIWLLILPLYSFAYSLSNTMFRPLLVDVGLSLAEIGWLLGIWGTSMTMVGSIVVGVFITQWGRRRSLLISSGLSIIGILTYFLPTLGLTQTSVLYTSIAIVFFSLGMVATSAFTIMMDKSRPESAGSDYSIQASLNTLGSIPAAAISGVIANAVGYRGVFALSTLLILLCIVLIAKYLDTQEVLLEDV
jgi:MFS transporter, PAT family, beta-lactamase induction signal transducer AmpG